LGTFRNHSHRGRGLVVACSGLLALARRRRRHIPGYTRSGAFLPHSPGHSSIFTEWNSASMIYIGGWGQLEFPLKSLQRPPAQGLTMSLGRHCHAARSCPLAARRRLDQSAARSGPAGPHEFAEGLQTLCECALLQGAGGWQSVRLKTAI